MDASVKAPVTPSGFVVYGASVAIPKSPAMRPSIPDKTGTVSGRRHTPRTWAPARICFPQRKTKRVWTKAGQVFCDGDEFGSLRRRIQFNSGIAAWLLDHPIRSAPSFIRRPSQPKQHRDFHQTERQLTFYRYGDIAQARKKGGLKFLYSQLQDALNTIWGRRAQIGSRHPGHPQRSVRANVTRSGDRILWRHALWPRPYATK